MEQVSDAALSGEAGQARSNGPVSTVFSIRMICGGEEQSTDLPLDQAMIGQLALEAEIRNMRIGELLAALIIAIVKGDLLEPLLRAAPKTGSERWMAVILEPEIGKTSMWAGMMGNHHNEYLFEVEASWLWCACALQARVVHAK